MLAASSVSTPPSPAQSSRPALQIHRQGSLYTSGDELMKAATGSALDPSVFLDYIKTKYSQLYQL